MTQQLRLQLGHKISFARDDFVVGATNQDAFSAVSVASTWHGNAIALSGPAGVGKSHLAKAWAQDRAAVILDRLAPDIDLAFGRPALIEDIDQGFDAEALFHLINMSPRPGAGLLLTARSPPLAWRTQLPDLRSRLNAMSVVEIHPPDDDVLGGLLRKLFKERGILPPDDLIVYLLTRMERSADSARRVVDRLDEVADQQQRPVSRLLARQVLEDEAENLDLFAPD
jgi:chromosomal replication initiation ATPase DnaA